MILASFLFALTMLFAKLLSSQMGPVEVTFWRNVVGIVVLGVMIWRVRLHNQGGRPWMLLFRGVVGTLALLAFFYTISATTLSDAIIYAKTEPIFTALLAFVLLGEKVSKEAIVALILGFLGMVLISGMELNTLSAVGLLTGFLSALAYTSVRSLKAYYDERTVVLSFMVSGTVLPLLLMILATTQLADHLLPEALSQPFVTPSLMEWVWIMLMGVAAAGGQMAMTHAYFYAKASIVSTASYTVVLFASLFGLILGDLPPTLPMIIGGLMIIASGLILARSR